MGVKLLAEINRKGEVNRSEVEKIKRNDKHI